VLFQTAVCAREKRPLSAVRRATPSHDTGNAKAASGLTETLSSQRGHRLCLLLWQQEEQHHHHHPQPTTTSVKQAAVPTTVQRDRLVGNTARNLVDHLELLCNVAVGTEDLCDVDKVKWREVSGGVGWWWW
jgi:hypothetical protein